MLHPSKFKVIRAIIFVFAITQLEICRIFLETHWATDFMYIKLPNHIVATIWSVILIAIYFWSEISD